MLSHETFSGTDIRVSAFFTWAFSDLRLNIVRGVLAEFLVAKALGDPRDGVRNAWDNYDVLSREGLRVEIKSSSYLQSWHQARLTRPSFSGLRRRTWSEVEGYSKKAEVKADVFVFALQTSKSHAEYDPLDLSQWSFWSAPAETVWKTGAKSLGLATVQAIGGDEADWWHLSERVSQVGQVV